MKKVTIILALTAILCIVQKTASAPIFLWPPNASGFAEGPSPSPSISILDVAHIPQQRDWWCWAATTEMISVYYGNNSRIPQCASANFVHGIPPNCCTGCTGDCPGWGDPWGTSTRQIRRNWNHWEFNVDEAEALTWDQIKQVIYPGRSPVQAVWWFLGGGGHVVIARGYEETEEGDRLVHVLDPWPPDCAQPMNPGETCQPQIGGQIGLSGYEAFNNDGVHSWGHSFFNFRRTSDTIIWSLPPATNRITHSQETTNPMVENAVTAANRQLKIFIRTELFKKEFSRFGFRSLSESTGAQLANPYDVVVIGLEDLKTYNVSDNPNTIIKSTKIRYFPVIVNGKAVTKLEIVNINNKWVPGEFGGITVTRVRAFAKSTEQLPLLLRDRSISAPQEVKFLRIPSLLADFLYVKSQQEEFLIPVMDQPGRYRLENGQMYNATEVLKILKEYAQRIDGTRVR